MVVIPGSVANVAISLILLLYLHTSLAEPKCPIGFEVAYSPYGDGICYQKKGPETFDDKFNKCSGNKFTMWMFRNFNIPKAEVKIWTDYKSVYPGGPFIDWSYANSTGEILDTTYEVSRDSHYGTDELLCVVMDPVTNFTAVQCDEKHYRYCFVDMYLDKEDMSFEGCETENSEYEYLRYWGPEPACLLSVEGKGLRATWTQAKTICRNKNGSLISHGWRYSNDPLFVKYTASPIYPLGVVFNYNSSELRFNTREDDSIIPKSSWNFIPPSNKEYSLGAINDGHWDFVNTSYTFYNVICEKPVELKHVFMNVSIDEENKIILYVNDTSLKKHNILCFTDSNSYYPSVVSKKGNNNKYVLKPFGQPGNGYYWCTHDDTSRFHPTITNKTLYIKVKEATLNDFAVKIVADEDYKLDKISKLLEKWEKHIEEYVKYSNSYLELFGDYQDSYNNYTIMEFKEKHSRHTPDIKVKASLKRLYLDARSALLHVQALGARAARPGRWGPLHVQYMRSVYYCRLPGILAPLALDESYHDDCKEYKCVGDFNNGVNLLITSEDRCYTPTNKALTTVITVTPAPPTGESIVDKPNTIVNIKKGQSSSEPDSSEEKEASVNIVELTTPYVETTTEYNPPPTKPPKPTTPPTTEPTTVYPTDTTTYIPLPEEQLQHVIDGLQTLLNNTEVFVEDIGDTMQQVDDLLADTKELDIPGDLLKLLDELGSRIYLNGSDDASEVRSNIALLVADAKPAAPVKGLRIAARDNDNFTTDAFEIIRDEINSTHLLSDASEVVVKLPDSVSISERRVSFVVFRNDRAFYSHSHYAVNSRVLSINVENVTHFATGEWIDIHLSPLAASVGRNASRTCAYWEFSGDGSGRWARDGCRLLRGAAGQLDTCRCDHLTHFAEVLVPRPAFSPADERALELLSTVGCCASVLGLAAVALTAALFRSWRRDFSNKIWLQLSAAVMLLSCTFLAVRFARFEGHEAGCVAAGVALHYAVLASFCWMVVAAVVAYRRLVRVFARDAAHKLLRAAAFAWGAPAALVGALLAAAPRAYESTYAEAAPAAAFCYPSGLALWLAVYAPLALMLLVNWTLFALIVRSVFGSRANIQRHGSDSNEALRCVSVSCLLVFLFGLPWVFGLFAFNVVAAYLFTILATFQGFALFLFFVVGNKKTRDLWLNKLRIKQTRKVPVTSSTYTQRSTSGAAPAQHAQHVQHARRSLEAKLSVPRSLHARDDSRFS